MKKIIRASILFISFTIASIADANINMSKNRLFFDSNQRSDALQLRNTGANTMNFNASMHLVEMTEEGTVKRVETLDNSAIKLIRFSPKRGTVLPGEKQVIRFSVRRPPKLPAGEYQAVLSLTTSIANNRAEAVTLNTKLAYNMPIIVRQGKTTANTSIENPRLIMIGNTPHIELWQTREGNRSLFGNFIATDSNNNEVGIVNGIAVYSSLAQRKVLIPLNPDAKAGDINIKYQEVAEFGGNLTASTNLQL